MASLDTLRSQFLQAETVLQTLDTELEEITCDPAEPRSVKRAVNQIIETIDRGFEKFKHNPVLATLAEDLKTQYVDCIQSQVAEANALIRR